MIRFAISVFVVALLAACSLNPLRGGDGARVVGDSLYCGTSSQDSETHYFPDRNTFEDWLEYRNIKDFDASLASNSGILVVELGQRPTSGYNIRLERDKTTVDDDTLKLAMTWDAPRLDAAVGQALTAPCVAIRLPQGEYSRIQVVDQLGNVRGTARLDR